MTIPPREPAAQLRRSAVIRQGFLGGEMGLYGTTILYPVGGRAPARDRLERVGREILWAFEDLQMLVQGTSEGLEPDRNPAAVTHLTRADPDSSLALVHFGVDARLLRPALGELIFTVTQAESSDGLDTPESKSSELLALPLLDVTVLSKPIRAVNATDGSPAFSSWAMIEFSFESLRFDEQVNYLRREDHPLLEELGGVLNADIGWTVVFH
jgi:hypothetical protein